MRKIQEKIVKKYNSLNSLPLEGNDYTIYFVNDGTNKKLYEYFADSGFVEVTYSSDLIYDYYPTKSSINGSLYNDKVKSLIVIEDETNFNNKTVYIYNGQAQSILNNTIVLPDISYLDSVSPSLINGKIVIINNDGTGNPKILYSTLSGDLYTFTLTQYNGVSSVFPMQFPLQFT